MIKFGELKQYTPEYTTYKDLVEKINSLSEEAKNQEVVILLGNQTFSKLDVHLIIFPEERKNEEGQILPEGTVAIHDEDVIDLRYGDLPYNVYEQGSSENPTEFPARLVAAFRNSWDAEAFISDKLMWIKKTK